MADADPALQEHINGAVETSFHGLITAYLKTWYAQAAYNKFTGEGDSLSDPYYNTVKQDIYEATMQNPLILDSAGITTLAQAKVALGPHTNYLNNRTDFRVIGLLTGIDVENLGPPFSLNIREAGFVEWAQGEDVEAQWARDDIFYNTGVGTTSQANTKLHYSFSLDSNPTEATTMESSKFQFFASTTILQYLANKAYAHPPGADNPYKDLALKLATDTKSMIDAERARAAGTMLRKPGEYLHVEASLGFVRHEVDAEVSWGFASDKMAKIISAIDAINPGSSHTTAHPLGGPELPLQDYTDLAEPVNQYTGVGGQQPDTGRILNGHHQILYANTHNDPQKAAVRDTLQALSGEHLSEYHTLFNRIIELEGRTPSEEEFEAGKQVELASILAFFGIGTDPDPLPDAPELATLEEAVQDPEAARALQEALERATRNLTPFDMQCYLMENITEIVAAKRAPRSDRPELYDYVDDEHEYNYVSRLTSVGSPSMITNLLQHGSPDGNKSKRIKQILNLCPEVYASLVPYIKIYRVDYDEDGSVTIDPETQKAAEKELVIPNFIDPTDLSSILDSSRGRIPGAGIKSFSWSLVGVQPAEVDNNITAKLVIYFQSINDFFRGASQAGKEEPNFLDLLINSPAAKAVQQGHRPPPDEGDAGVCGDLKKNLHRRYEGRNYRIKVVAGWSTPSNLIDLMPKSDPEDIERLQEAIASTRVSLFLQQVRHSLDFKDDGALEMSIDYQASLAGLLTSPQADIFADDPIDIRTQVQALDAGIEDLDDLGDTIGEYDKQRRKELLERKLALNRRGKMHKYKKLLEGLFKPQKYPKIHAINISGAEMHMPHYRDLDDEARARRAERRLGTPLEFADTFELYTELLNSVTAGAADSEVDAAAQYEKCEESRYEDYRKDSKIKTLPFFFLGDIIDNVIGQMIKNTGKELDFDVFLSDVEIIDPLQAFKLKNLDDILTCGDIRTVEFLDSLRRSDLKTFGRADGVVNIMNIGDIPISTDAFQLFFKNRVVKKDRETYHFLYFIKELCAELITKALNKTCFGPDISFQQRFDVRPHTWAPDGVVFDDGYRYVTWASNLTVGQLAKQSDILPSTPIGHTRQALIVLPTDSHPRNLTGDYATDTGKGIYHHYIGASCGLLKTLKFNREDQEYLREAKIQRQGALGAEQLRELYSSTLELVGNNLYKNGMYIYINPTLMDASEVELDYLGLHGYYLVTGVQSSVTPQGFTTNLTALHEGIEFNAPDIDPEWWNVPPESLPPDIDSTSAAARSRVRQLDVDREADDPTSAASRYEAERRLERARIYGDGPLGQIMGWAYGVEPDEHGYVADRTDIANEND